MMLANLLIALGTLLLAFGGVIATAGWNARGVAAERDGMIRAVAGETLVNSNIFRDPVFTDNDDEKLARFTLFPRMQTAALEGAIASGNFVGEKDRVFFTRAVDLKERLEDFNQRLSFSEARMADSPSEVLSLRKKLRDSAVRRDLGQRISKLGKLLMSEYEVRSDDTFFVEIED